MRRALGYAPVALLTSACATRPWTESTADEAWAVEMAPAQTVVLPSYQEAAARWQLPPQSPWAPYQKMTLLSSLGAQHVAMLPDVQSLEVVGRAESAGARVAAAGLPADTMWVVDLRGAASVAFGAQISRGAHEPVAPVLTFNNWPAENELVPAEETLAALATFYPAPIGTVDASAARPIFMLDSWRLAYRDEAIDDLATDNRYLIQGSDLPDPETLRARGISRVIYVVESVDDAATEEDDLHEIFAAYQRAGVQIFMVDLDWLARPLTPRVWYTDELRTCGYVVQPRVTIVGDARFYSRSRGGFGGIHGAPFGAHHAHVIPGGGHAYSGGHHGSAGGHAGGFGGHSGGFGGFGGHSGGFGGHHGGFGG